MARKITIIGGSGFVGTNLCRQLELNQQDFEIIDLKVSNQFPDKCKISDVRDADSLRETITGDVVVNLAAVHRDDIIDKKNYLETNVYGAKNIAQVCKEKDIRKIVFTSSVAVYGLAPPGTGEGGRINPFNEYGRTKYLAEEMFRAWQRQGDNSLIIVRPTVIFGEGNRGNVFNLFKQIASEKFLMVGSGRNKKSMAYIGNVVPFILECIKTDLRYSIFNYVDTPCQDMNTLVSDVKHKLGKRKSIRLRLPVWLGLMLGYIADFTVKISGRRLPISAIRVKKFCASSDFSSDKNSLNGFSQPYSLSEGISRTLKSEFLDPSPNQEIFYTE